MDDLEAFLATHTHLNPRMAGVGPGGWRGLILEALQAILELERQSGCSVTIEQIKGKFGGLRLYCVIDDGSTAGDLEVAEVRSTHTRLRSSVEPGTPTETLRRITDAAEDAASCTCQVCGAAGELGQRGSLVLTACKKHRDRE